MKQQGDILTEDLFPVPRRPGRPRGSASGSASTGAQRQAAYHAKRQAAVGALREDNRRLLSEVERLNAQAGCLRSELAQMCSELDRLRADLASERAVKTSAANRPPAKAKAKAKLTYEEARLMGMGLHPLQIAARQAREQGGEGCPHG